MRLVQVNYMPLNETGAIRLLCSRFLGCQCVFFWRFLSFLVMGYFEFSKFSKMKSKPSIVPKTRRSSPGHCASDKKEKRHPSAHVRTCSCTPFIDSSTSVKRLANGFGAIHPAVSEMPKGAHLHVHMCARADVSHP